MSTQQVVTTRPTLCKSRAVVVTKAAVLLVMMALVLPIVLIAALLAFELPSWSIGTCYIAIEFPTKSICGRLGNWTPAAHWAPDKMAELVTYRKIKLDLWTIELTELLSRKSKVNEHVRTMCLEFFQKPAGCPPCERANPVHWANILSLEPTLKSSEICSVSLADEVSLKPYTF